MCDDSKESMFFKEVIPIQQVLTLRINLFEEYVMFIAKNIEEALRLKAEIAIIGMLDERPSSAKKNVKILKKIALNLCWLLPFC